MEVLPMVTKARRGQALMELTVGLFALALVVSALCGFAIYIAKSLKMQNSLRVGSSSQHATLEVSEFAAEYLFGSKSLNITEKVVMPPTVIMK